MAATENFSFERFKRSGPSSIYRRPPLRAPPNFETCTRKEIKDWENYLLRRYGAVSADTTKWAITDWQEHLKKKPPTRRRLKHWVVDPSDTIEYEDVPEEQLEQPEDMSALEDLGPVEDDGTPSGRLRPQTKRRIKHWIVDSLEPDEVIEYEEAPAKRPRGSGQIKKCTGGAITFREALAVLAGPAGWAYLGIKNKREKEALAALAKKIEETGDVSFLFNEQNNSAPKNTPPPKTNTSSNEDEITTLLNQYYK